MYHSDHISYTPTVARRTTIEVDEKLLRDAQRVLGTTGLKDTVDKALLEIVRTDARRRLAHALRAGTAFDFESAPVDRDAQWRR